MSTSAVREMGRFVGVVCRVAHWCRAATGRKAAWAAFAAGSVSVLAMAPFFLSPVLFVTLPVLLWLCERDRPSHSKRVAAAAWSGWWFGFGYFLFGLFWIGEAFMVEAERFLWALPFAVTLLPAGLALFFATATAVTAGCGLRGFQNVLPLAVAISGTEWLRGHILTGFPWNTVGYALTMPLPLMQSAAVIGIYGLTLLAVPVFTTPGAAIADESRRSGGALNPIAFLTIAPLALMLAYGAVRLSAEEALVPGVRLRIVQPSVPQREKWRPENQRQIFFQHIDLSQRTPDGKPDPELKGIAAVIWPEAAMPFQPLNAPAALTAIGDMLPAGKFLLSGGLRTVTGATGEIEARNSLMIFDANGAATQVYDKIHLVPFGEYLPLRPLIERIGLQELAAQRGGFGIGPSPRPLLDLPGLPAIGPLICYEAIFPAAIVQGVARPGVLLNVTNDGWFGNTTGPRQHFHQARVRAVEEGLPLVRAANNGISALITPHGRVTSRLGMNAVGTIDAELPQAAPSTVYSRIGDSAFYMAWASGLIFIVYMMLRRQKLISD